MRVQTCVCVCVCVCVVLCMCVCVLHSSSLYARAERKHSYHITADDPDAIEILRVTIGITGLPQQGNRGAAVDVFWSRTGW